MLLKCNARYNNINDRSSAETSDPQNNNFSWFEFLFFYLDVE